MRVTRRRLALINSLIIFAVIALYVLVFVPVRAALTLRAVDEDLQAMGDQFAQSPSVPPVVDPFAAHPVFVQSIRLNGTVVARSANIGDDQLPLEAGDLGRAGSGQPWFEYVAFAGHQLRSYERPAHLDASAPATSIDGIVEVATPLDDAPPHGPILIGLIAGVLLGGAAVVAVGWLLARIAMAPVEQLAVTVDSIGSTDELARRLPVDKFGLVRLDPVVRLTYAFNAMLDRLQVSTEQLERSLQLQRQFVADASHQLRTPLTSLRGNVQLLARRCAEDCPLAAVDAHQPIFRDLDAELDRMSRLVNGLLVLARADAQVHLTRVPLDLKPTLIAAWRTARELSATVRVELGEIPEVQVRGDADRLRQMWLVLLENAVAYSPPGTRVQLRAMRETRQTRPGVTVEVADAGPGVAAGERELIFERFYRSRRTAAATEGVGLGLSVARWIAQEHEAEISVEDNEPTGSVFRVWLPTLHA